MEKYLLVTLWIAVSLLSVGHCGAANQWKRRVVQESMQQREFTCTEGDGYYASPGACTDAYYYCENGLAETQTCPEGNVFDPVTLVCTISSQASCNQEFDCTSDGLFPYPDACTNLYYICSGGQSYIEYCPENFVFDPIILKCEPKEGASCSPTTTELPTTTTGQRTTTTEESTTTTEASTTTTEASTTTTKASTTTTEASTTTIAERTTITEALTTVVKM